MAKISFYASIDVLKAESLVTSVWSDIQKYGSSRQCILRRFETLNDAKKWSLKMCNRVKVGDKFEEDVVFFDSGTSRLSMVEVRVTDSKGESVLDRIVNKYFLNDKKNIGISWNKYTNNFGELLACCLALKYAVQENKKFIYGDSAITIFFWLSHEFSDKLDKCTVAVIKNACMWLRLFEDNGGRICYISRERNRADLFYLK